MPEKMPALVRILKWTGISLAVLTAAIAVLMWSLYLSSDLKMPDCEFHDDEELLFSDSLRVYGDNWLRLSESGLWEMKVSGSAPDRICRRQIVAGPAALSGKCFYRADTEDNPVGFLSEVPALFHHHVQPQSR